MGLLSHAGEEQWEGHLVGGEDLGSGWPCLALGGAIQPVGGHGALALQLDIAALLHLKGAELVQDGLGGRGDVNLAGLT